MSYLTALEEGWCQLGFRFEGLGLGSGFGR